MTPFCSPLWTTTNRPPQQRDTDLCSASVWAGTRPLPPLQVGSPHRSESAPREAASSPAFWGSSEHPTHRPRAPRDTADTSRCSLRERENFNITSWLMEVWRRGGHLLQSSISGRVDGFLSSFPNSFLEFFSCLTCTCTSTHWINHHVHWLGN